MKQNFNIKTVKGGRMMVRVIETREDDTTEGGIIIATTEARRELFPYEEGEVILSGDADAAIQFSPGDKVLISNMTPRNPVNKGETEDGKTFRDWMLFASDIVAILE